MCNSVKIIRKVGENDYGEKRAFACCVRGGKSLIYWESKYFDKRDFRVCIGEAPASTCQSTGSLFFWLLGLDSGASFCYTCYMLEFIQKHGLLDGDFLSTLGVLMTILLLAEVNAMV